MTALICLEETYTGSDSFTSVLFIFILLICFNSLPIIPRLDTQFGTTAGWGFDPTPFCFWQLILYRVLQKSFYDGCYLIISHLFLQILVNPHVGYEGSETIVVIKAKFTKVILQPRPPVGSVGYAAQRYLNNIPHKS